MHFQHNNFMANGNKLIIELLIFDEMVMTTKTTATTTRIILMCTTCFGVSDHATDDCQ